MVDLGDVLPEVSAGPIVELFYDALEDCVR